MLYGLIVKMRKHRYSRVFPPFFILFELECILKCLPLGIFLAEIKWGSVFKLVSRWVSTAWIFACNLWPFNANAWVVPRKTALITRMIEVSYFVAELSFCHLIRGTVCKAFAYIELLLVLFCKFYAKPFAVCLRTCTKVNSNIKYASFDYTYKLSLRKFFLEV